ncbi:MarR family transcriptional regulator [Pseudomonas sp. Fl5BN2]|uniref:MarR family winged helix-turn-helix transcriptional regulator n=1 Tax=unclassified Pseudomonas TaxID=196821 RepID=UPI0013767B70|nr:MULTISPECIES: MarR family transcriptional regulator [unclassified Pseudomonas]NBF05696.1 MarR family transcriptional regulator [Pseudomonas sp. Fl5BN2]NBF11613.1 MarR family transcriptional regulator [Pseudomonas sp. Fl4BN1]
MSADKWRASGYAGPSDSPGFRFWRDFLDWQRQLNARLKPLGLTQPQFAILAVCGWLTREGEPITQSGIANFTGMDRMHISQIVARLERDGLLAKRTDPNDQRANLLSLSEGGQQQLRLAMPIVEAFDAEFFLARDAASRPASGACEL